MHNRQIAMAARQLFQYLNRRLRFLGLAQGFSPPQLGQFDLSTKAYKQVPPDHPSYHAAELLNEFVLAMKQKIGLNKILGTIHVYPTLSEANKFAASEWRKARKPEGLLAWVERYHRWVRGGS